MSEVKPTESNQKPIPKGYISLDKARDEHTENMLKSTKLNAKDKTINRDLKIKDTFTSVFPAYNLTAKKEFVTTNQSVSSTIANSKAERVDKEHHLKLDSFKIYTEEMLKAKNMRMQKK
jgi:hypothetical protein